MDMLTQTLIEDLLLDFPTLLVGKHPVGKLRMPAQAVATQFDTILSAEVSNLVSLFKVPYALLRMQHTGFHVVLSSNAAEFGLHQINLVSISDVTLIQCNTNHKVVLVGILQLHGGIWINRCTPLCPRTQTIHGHHDGQNSFQSLFHLVIIKLVNSSDYLRLQRYKKKVTPAIAGVTNSLADVS